MGLRGPVPKPKVFEPTKAHTKQGSNLPSGEIARPRMPIWLPAEAKSVWRQLMPDLHAMGILHRVDRNALTRYCVLWVRWRRAVAFLDEHGEVYPLLDEHGQVKYMQQWPQVAIANKLAIELRRIEQEFGLTPSARTRINVTIAAPESPVILKRDRTA